VVGVDAVESDDGVQVGDAAALHFGGLAGRTAAPATCTAARRVRAEITGTSGMPGSCARRRMYRLTAMVVRRHSSPAIRFHTAYPL
jgi:hypothetical protein